MTARRGSVLIMALWIIAILSVMVVSFAFEARQQAGIDVYVRERNRVSRLIDSGRVLGEVVLLGYKDAPDPEIKSGAPDWDDAFEDDRWVVEKYNLKTDHKCTIGPIRLDESDPDEEDEGDAPTVTVELKFESAAPKIDITKLTDEKGFEIFKTVLRDSGIDDELEVEVEDADRSGRKKHNLINLLVASFKDWVDEDDTVSRGPFESGSDYDYNPQDDDGAEKSWYEDRDEEDEIPVKDRRVPANGPIKQLEELSYIRGFRDFPSVLTGGRLYDNTESDDKRGSKHGKDDKDDESNPQLTGIMDNFKIGGGQKIELNDETREKDLKTILGPMYDPDDTSASEDLNDLIQAILTALKTMPEDDDDIDETRTWWPFKDMSDLEKRVDDIGFSEKVPEDLKEYIRWPGESAASSSGKSDKDKKGGASEDAEKFSMTITGESLGMKYVVTARCIVEDKKVRYIEWSENELTNEKAKK